MRPELEQYLHKTLDSMKVKSEHAHLIVEWIGDEDDEQRRLWQLRALGMFAIGLALGLSIGFWLI